MRLGELNILNRKDLRPFEEMLRDLPIDIFGDFRQGLMDQNLRKIAVRTHGSRSMRQLSVLPREGTFSYAGVERIEPKKYGARVEVVDSYSYLKISEGTAKSISLYSFLNDRLREIFDIR